MERIDRSPPVHQDLLHESGYGLKARVVYFFGSIAGSMIIIMSTCGEGVYFVASLFECGKVIFYIVVKTQVQGVSLIF